MIELTTVDIGGLDAAFSANEIRECERLVPPTCASVEHTFAGLCVQERSDPLGALFLNHERAVFDTRPPTRVATAAEQDARSLDLASRNFGVGQGFAELGDPGLAITATNAQTDRRREGPGGEKLLDLRLGERCAEGATEPSRRTEKDRVGDRGSALGLDLACDMAKDRVCERPDLHAAFDLERLDGRRNCGVRRDTLEKEQLIGPHEQMRSNGGVDRVEPAVRVTREASLEITRGAQGAVGELCTQTAIAGVELRITIDLGAKDRRGPGLLGEHALDHGRGETTRVGELSGRRSAGHGGPSRNAGSGGEQAFRTSKQRAR
jgi:hypothetical protein